MLDGLELAVGPALRLRRAACRRHQVCLFRLEEQLLLERATQPMWKSKFCGAFVLNRRVGGVIPSHWLISTQTICDGIIPGMIQNFSK